MHQRRGSPAQLLLMVHRERGDEANGDLSAILVGLNPGIRIFRYSGADGMTIRT